jgi:hypothetical protein
MSKIDKLPVLGKVSLPVHIMHLDNNKNPKRYFQSGFAFFAVADDQADVTGADDKHLGSLGSCMGGHYQVHVNNVKEGDDSIHVIINVEDLWKEVTKLIGSESVQLQFEGMVKTYNEYWAKHQAEEEAEKAKKVKLREIEQMQREAEEERIRKAEEAARELREKNYKSYAKPSEEIVEGIEGVTKFDEIQLLDDNGWDVTKKIVKYDWDLDEECKDEYQKIPLDYGLGVKTKYHGQTYTFKRNPRKKPTVTLKISTWRGSIGAIHYYGILHIDLPEMAEDGKTGFTCSPHHTLPMFENDQIQLTQILEAWEIERYPHNYEYLSVGDHHRGFYTPEAVIRHGEEFFKKYFEEGWKLKTERLF